MGYYASSGVIRGVYIPNVDLGLQDELPDDLDWYVWTDTEEWFMVVGKELVEFEEEEVRAVRLPVVDPAEDARIQSKLWTTKLIDEKLIEENYGTWFIQGGS